MGLVFAIKDPFYQDAFEHIIRVEGGYVDNVLDTPTKYGVTLKALREYHHNPDLTKEDIANLTLTSAHEFYYNQFWKPLGLVDCINSEASIAIFDQAVNRGVGAVKAQVQQLLSMKLSPGFPTEVEVLNFYYQQKDLAPRLQYSFLINFIILSQKSYLSIVKTRPTAIAFLDGWMARTQNLLLLASR